MEVDMQKVTNQIRFYISEIKSLQDENKDLKNTIKLDSERYRGIITELEVELEKFKDDERCTESSKNN